MLHCVHCDNNDESLKCWLFKNEIVYINKLNSACILNFQAPYTDPQTKMRYATSEEFTRGRMLPGDLVMNYLALRKANPPVP